MILLSIEKDPRTTTLGEAIPATGRIIVESPNTNPNKIRMKLVNGDLVSEKLDYEYIVRIGTELFYQIALTDRMILTSVLDLLSLFVTILVVTKFLVVVT